METLATAALAAFVLVVTLHALGGGKADAAKWLRWALTGRGAQ